MTLSSRIGEVVASDRTKRGVSFLFRGEYLEEAARLLGKATKVAVVTGFYGPSCAAPETDGPGGAAAIGRCLARWGCDVSIVTDRFCAPAVSACSRAIGGPPVRTAETGEDVLSGGTDLVLFIERLGRAGDGRYYNMRGEDVSPTTVPLDGAALAAAERDIPVVAVGDGGNETGMGNFLGPLSSRMPDYGPCLSVVGATVTLAVDVSDWGGYALCVPLSRAREVWLGPEEDEVEAMTAALVREHAVDGVTRRREPTVDGLPVEVHQEVIRGLRVLGASR